LICFELFIRDAPDIRKVFNIQYYQAFFYYPDITSRISLLFGEVSGWNLISLKFKLLIFLYLNVLEINMHIHDAIISYIYIIAKLQFFSLIGLFSLSFFFLEHFLGIRSDFRKMSDIQFEEIAFSDIRLVTGYPMLHSVRISDIRYSVILRSDAFLLFIHTLFFVFATEYIFSWSLIKLYFKIKFY